jgi:hypothetical protein
MECAAEAGQRFVKQMEEIKEQDVIQHCCNNMEDVVKMAGSPIKLTAAGYILQLSIFKSIPMNFCPFCQMDLLKLRIRMLGDRKK